MTDKIILFFSIGLSIIFFLLFLLEVFKNQKFKKNLKILLMKEKILSTKLSFEEDFKFLTFTIKAFSDSVVKYKLQPLMRQKNVGIVKDDEIEKCSLVVVKNVLELLSPSYKVVLFKYLKDDKILTEFIAKLVYESILETSLNLNKRKLGSLMTTSLNVPSESPENIE